MEATWEVGPNPEPSEAFFSPWFGSMFNRYKFNNFNNDEAFEF